MADEHAATPVSGPRPAAPRPNETPPGHGAHTAAAPRRDEAANESRAKGMLKEAIQKVMEEIEFHEREAQKHRQQAEAL